MDENNKFDVVGTNIAEKATMIWNVADMLRGPFKPHEYGLVILPMTVVKRFHDCLLPTHKAVLEQYEKVKNFAVIDGFLTKASGYQFYNISKYTFESLLADPENIEANFRDYLNGFSANVQDVLAKFDFDNIIRRMVESNTLYLVIKEFNSQKGYLGPDKISAVDCGYIFERRPNDHLTKTPDCMRCSLLQRHFNGFSRKGFIDLCNKNNNGIGILYVIRCWDENEEFYKIGITSRSVGIRFQWSHHLPYKYEIVQEILCNPDVAWDLEKILHKLYINYGYRPLKNFRGKTECFKI